MKAANRMPTLPYDSRENSYSPHQVLTETTSACQLRCKMCAEYILSDQGPQHNAAKETLTDA
jgi:MoaA/NifB/PqqE/SkfB family radical SAM enzyme